MKNKKADISLIRFIVYAALILVAALLIGWIFIHGGIKEGLGPAYNSLIASAKEGLAKVIPGLGDTSGGTTDGGTTGGTGEGDEANEGWNVYSIEIKSQEDWMKCDAKAIYEKVKKGTASAEEKACFSGYTVSEEPATTKKRCYCVNKAHVETGGDESEAYSLTISKADQGINIKYSKITTVGRNPNDVILQMSLSTKGAVKCDTTYNFCIKFIDFEDSNKKAKIGVRTLSTQQGTTLEIGKTYYLKKGSDYQFKSVLGTHTIRYKDDTSKGVFIYVSEPNNPSKEFNCVGFGGWDVYIGSALCCSEKYKICGKVIERDTAQKTIKFLVCDTEKC